MEDIASHISENEEEYLDDSISDDKSVAVRLVPTTTRSRAKKTPIARTNKAGLPPSTQKQLL